MRILLDECVPRRFAGTARPRRPHRPRDGLVGQEERRIVRLDGDRQGFEVLLTVDQNLRHQRNLRRPGVAVDCPGAASNRLADLVPLMPPVQGRYWVRSARVTSWRSPPKDAIERTRLRRAAGLGRSPAGETRWKTITILYRPVGPKELAPIEASGSTAFPPRLPEQPIFYPVLNEEYAAWISRNWNVRDHGSGYVTRFRDPRRVREALSGAVRRGRPCRRNCGCPPRNWRSSIGTLWASSRWSTSSMANEAIQRAPLIWIGWLTVGETEAPPAIGSRHGDPSDADIPARPAVFVSEPAPSGELRARVSR